MPMTAPSRISVAMGTYNGARFLREQLESLAKQTYLPLELVVCDDTSTDATAQIVQEFGRTAPFPVRFEVNETRLGFADNFLKASSLCEGELIAFCDQDDVWYPEKLGTCANALTAKGTILCSHDADLCDGDGKVIGEHVTGVKSGTYGALALKPWDIFFGFTCVFRRELLQVIDPALRPADDRNPDRKMSHDSWVYFVANSFGDTVYVAKRLVKYRQHGSNLYGSADLSTLQKVGKLINQYEPYLRKYRGLAEGRARALELGTPPAEFADRAAAAHRFWSNLARLYDRRLRVAEGRSLASRSRRVADLWRDGTYVALSEGGIGARALVEDVVAAVSRSLPIGAGRNQASR